MSVAEAVTQDNPEQSPSVPAEVTMQGRVDAIDGGRLFGWVWDRDRPAERLTVRVMLAGQQVATTVADKPRIDLRRNGIGDGAYAFDIPLTPEIAAHGRELSVIAASAGVEMELRNPTADERAAEAAVAAPLARVLERLDLLVAAQRQTLLSQRETAQIIQEKSNAASAALGGDEAGDIARRIGELEIFLVRFDATLRGFDARLKTLSERDSGQLKPLLLIFAAIGGVAAGVIASLAVGL